MANNCCTLDLNVEEPVRLSLGLGESYHGPYVLPTMDADTKGGAKLGSGLTVDANSALNVNDEIAHGNVRAFDTVSDMQAATDLVDGMTCHTNGFHTVGDGGAAFYTVSDTGTANGMDVLALAGDLFATLVITESYVTPEMFGAYGDGVADDTNAIVKVFEFENVIIGKDYKITVPNDAYVTFSDSNHYGIEVLSKKVSGNGTLYITGDNGLICKNDCVLNDFSIVQNTANDYAIILCKSAIVKNVHVSNGLGGIIAPFNKSVTEYYSYKITNCLIENMSGTVCFGIWLMYAGISEISDNLICNISTNDNADCDAIKIWQDEDSLTDKTAPVVTIKNNVIHNIEGRFVKDSAINTTICDNVFYNDNDFSVISAFCAVDSQKGNCNLLRNHITAQGGVLISLKYTDSKVSFIGNTVKLNSNTPTRICFDVTMQTDSDAQADTRNYQFTIEDNYLQNEAGRAMVLTYASNVVYNIKNVFCNVKSSENRAVTVRAVTGVDKNKAVFRIDNCSSNNSNGRFIYITDSYNMVCNNTYGYCETKLTDLANVPTYCDVYTIIELSHTITTATSVRVKTMPVTDTIRLIIVYTGLACYVFKNTGVLLTSF